MTDTAAPGYGPAEIRAEVQAWQDAATAARADAHDQAALLLAPPGRTPADAHTRMHSQALIGAALVARRLAQLENVPPLVRPDGDGWVLESTDPSREHAAVDRVAGVAITALANGEPERAAAAVAAFALPEETSADRLVALMFRLLNLYLVLDDALNAPRGAS
ncbi:hypothetical protein [Pseudonocardia sp. NPDC049635]|uniref:hypothetical protein n=1 Tax=Pseudonocardia sp. NPDC049635 TaxID=3155506 RepID=UPI0033DE594A